VTMLDPNRLTQAVNGHLPEMLDLRRDFHRHPELSGQETRTADRAATRLEQAGLKVQRGVSGAGFTALLGSGEPCVALRADMDALPITEETGLPWASETPGVMHACGHDFHTAWLVGAGLVLQDLGLPRGSVKLIFQPAEEALWGATGMIAGGALEAPRVSAIAGAHVWTEAVVGDIALMPGPNLAAADRFTITLHGQGTHGSSPHRGADPIPAAAELVLALQTLVSRRLDPLHAGVVSVCQLHGGTAFNIIPPRIELSGTVRTLEIEDRDLLQAALCEMASQVAAVHGCRAEVDYERGVPPTVADEQVTTLAREALTAVLGADHVPAPTCPNMGAEDFSYYLERVPGAWLRVGCAPSDASAGQLSLHGPHFIADEGCLAPAMAGMAAFALAALERL
jgi:amidohydrolase